MDPQALGSGDPDPAPSLLWAVRALLCAVLLSLCCFVSTWIFCVSFPAASCSLQRGLSLSLLPQLKCGDQERDKERFLENRGEGKQFHVFEIQEVLILLFLVIVYTFKGTIRTLGLDGLS